MANWGIVRRYFFLAIVWMVATSATATWAQFKPPRILMPINASNTGTLSDSLLDLRRYFIDKGLETSIRVDDVLNVYREKRMSRDIPHFIRMMIGTMTITDSQMGSSIGRFEPIATTMNHPLIRHKRPMKGDVVVPRLAIDSGVLFDPGVFQLKPGAVGEFDKVASFVKTFTPSKLMVEGHTDSDGSDDLNLELSIRRAEQVKRYLVASYEFITPAMVESRGYGETRPIADNDSPENKQLNRRIEVLVWE